jgi:hypothetical protein
VLLFKYLKFFTTFLGGLWWLFSGDTWVFLWVLLIIFVQLLQNCGLKTTKSTHKIWLKLIKFGGNLAVIWRENLGVFLVVFWWFSDKFTVERWKFVR